MKITNIVIASIALIIIIFAVITYTKDDVPSIKEVTTATTSISTINDDPAITKDLSEKIFSPAVTTEEKIEAIKKLKALSLDETKDVGVRLYAGQAVVSTFFEYGITLHSGFSDKVFSERDIYEYAKNLNTLGDSVWNSLLTAYIGLNFYSNEIDKKFVSDLLLSNQRAIAKYGTSNKCYQGSKIGSVIYLSQKNVHTDVSKEFGNYYDTFNNTFESVCSENQKPLIGFMWLAAISDIGKTETENKKAKELISIITKDTSKNSALVQNLRSSYFATPQEPDTVAIVNRLVSKYPEFKVFIEKIK